jgi:hypothetical protein
MPAATERVKRLFHDPALKSLDLVECWTVAPVFELRTIVPGQC